MRPPEIEKIGMKKRRTLHLIRQKSCWSAETKSSLAVGGALVAAVVAVAGAGAVWKEEDHRDSEVRPWAARLPKHDPVM